MDFEMWKARTPENLTLQQLVNADCGTGRSQTMPVGRGATTRPVLSNLALYHALSEALVIGQQVHHSILMTADMEREVLPEASSTSDDRRLPNNGNTSKQ